MGIFRLVAAAFFLLQATALGSAGALAESTQEPPVLSAQQWRADLKYLAEQMPIRHKNLYHTMSPRAFADAVARLDRDIPNLNADQIVVRLVQIATMPENSHTGVFGLPPAQCFPLRLRHYDEGLYVEAAPPRYAAAVGGRLVAVNTTPADKVYTEMLTIIPHDGGNPGLLDFIGPVLMTMGHVLHGLDVTSSADSASFIIEKGRRRLNLDLTPGVAASALFGHAPIPGWVDARGTAPPPLWLAHPDKTFWSTYLADTKTFYIQFNAVQDTPEETVAQFFERTFAAVRAAGADKLVLDVRMNDGGNNYLLKPIIVGLVRLENIDRKGHLFVVIDRNTYSAAQNLVNRLELYTEATFVGRPTGQHVNSYGDPVPITLPNSHIRVGMASVWWQDTDERDKRKETDPEIAADPTFADYAANRDPALWEIDQYRQQASLEALVSSGIAARGVQGGLAAYAAFASDPIHRYTVARMESRINALGYELLGQHRIADAIAVFTVNVRANPKFANAEDSLGEAYAIAGDRQEALTSYRRALALDPNLESSRAALSKLGASVP